MSTNNKTNIQTKIIISIIFSILFLSFAYQNIVTQKPKNAEAQEISLEQILEKKQIEKKVNELEIQKTENQLKNKGIDVEIQKLLNPESSPSSSSSSSNLPKTEEVKEVEKVSLDEIKADAKEKPKVELNEHEDRIFKACSGLGMKKEESAFVLANVSHETAKFKFMEEIDGRNQAKRLNYGGGENWYGRGYIQLTHLSNYQNWSRWLGVDLVSNPNLLITDFDLSAKIACSGIQHGSFTGKGKLADYNGDWSNARALVNGDKNYQAGCDTQKCWTIGTKIKDLTNYYISIL